MAGAVEIVEAIGGQQEQVTSAIWMLRSDAFSTTRPDPLPNRVDGQSAYSTERWIRIRFTPPFAYIERFRFWAPGLVVPSGWTLKWGTRTTFSAPSRTASSIAIDSIPTADPGATAPNIGGIVALDGSRTRYSDWIVLQASAARSVVAGLMLATGITFNFAWQES